MGWISRVLTFFDERNQRTADAEIDRVQPTGAGIIIDVRPLDGREPRLVGHVWLWLDGAKQRVPWGTSFVASECGDHTIRLAYKHRYGWRARTERRVTVPAEGHLRVEFRCGHSLYSPRPVIDIR